MKSVLVATLLGTVFSKPAVPVQNVQTTKPVSDGILVGGVDGLQIGNNDGGDLLNIINGVQLHTDDIQRINQSYQEMRKQLSKTNDEGSLTINLQQQQTSISSSGSASGSGSEQKASSNDHQNADSFQIQMLTRQGSSGAEHRNQDVSVYRRNSMEITREAADSLQTNSLKFDNIFLRFPTCDELDRLIISADSGALLKTIQSIAIDDNVPCDKKISYLLQLEGRLKTAIQMKSHNAKQLQIVIEASYTEIEKARAEMQSTTKLLDGLGLEEMKRSQKKQTKDLQLQYGILNDVEGQLPILQAQVMGYEKEIGIVSKDIQVERSRVDNDKLKLLQVGNQIGKIQTRLRELQDVEAAIRDRVGKSEQKVSDNDRNVAEIRVKIKITEQNLKKSKDDHDVANSQVKDLQVKVQRIRTDVAIAQSKKDRYQKQISTLQTRLNAQKKKAVNDDLDDLNQMVSSLNDLIPSVQTAIDKHYYNCYGGGSSVKVQQNGGVTVYVVSGSKFGDYLRSLYGDVKIPSIREDVTLNRVNIFGADWTGKFGYPFADAAFKNDDFSFSGSFSCVNPGATVSGYGTISAIGSDYIEAKDEKGATNKFSLGSCSRLQSSSKIPKIGHKFYWQGVVGSKGFNLYSGSCLE